LEAQQSNATGLVCFDTITRSITILSKPDTAIITNIRTANCSPYLMTASVPGFTTELITWYVYDTTLPVYPVVIANPVLNYTFNNSGRFKVVMVIENASGCKDSSFRFLNVYAKPVAGFTPLNLVTCSLDTTVSYINNTTANIYTPLTYRWYVDGIQRATSGNFTYRYTALPSDNLPRIFFEYYLYLLNFKILNKEEFNKFLNKNKFLSVYSYIDDKDQFIFEFPNEILDSEKKYYVPNIIKLLDERIKLYYRIINTKT
jgi:hypothetical protein